MYWQWLLRCCIVILTVGLALLVTFLVKPFQAIPSALFYAAVLLSTRYGGRLPGFLSIALSFAILHYFFIEPARTLVLNTASALQMGAFLFVAFLINWLTISRQQAHAQAGESRLFTQAIADSTPNILYIYDLKEERNVYVNRGVVPNLGYTPGEIQEMGSGMLEKLIDPQYLPRTKEHMRAFQQTSNGEVFDFEYRVRHKNGDWRWLWSRESVFKRNMDGSPRQIVGTAYDITKRKLAAQERERFFAVSSDLLLIADFEGSFQWLSPAWQRALGWTLEEMTSQPWLHFVHPEDHEKTIAEAERIYAGQETIAFENRYRHKDGSYRWIGWRVRPFVKEGLIYGSATDITERKHLEEQVRQSQKLEAVGQLAGGIAHDFNNILTAIVGYSDLALRRVKRGDPLCRNIEEIKKAGERAASLTRQLLAFSRKQVLQPKVFELNALVEDMSHMLSRLIGEDVELVTKMRPMLGRIYADPGQIEQVLINLVVNARDAMPRGGKITIETSNTYLDERYADLHMAVKAGDYVMLAVSDTGKGMDAETQKRVFEPFFTTKERGKGTGLGLSTIYGIIKQSGGNIWVYSEVGTGTTFKVYLPRVEDKSEVYGFGKTVREIPRGAETILLVEDEEMVRMLAEEILQERGYTVMAAPTVRAAIELARRAGGPINLLLTDVVMPEMSGRELAERIHIIRPEAHVLYMSGYTDDSIVHHGVLDEGVSLLEKPFTADGLALKVREVLDAQVI